MCATLQNWRSKNTAQRTATDNVVSKLQVQVKLKIKLQFCLLWTRTWWLPNVFPQHVLHSNWLLSSHMLWQMLSSFHLYIGGPKGKNSILQNRTFYCGGASTGFFFCLEWWANSQIGLLQTKENWTWKAHDLVNRKGEWIGEVEIELWGGGGSCPRHISPFNKVEFFKSGSILGCLI